MDPLYSGLSPKRLGITKSVTVQTFVPEFEDLEEGELESDKEKEDRESKVNGEVKMEDTEDQMQDVAMHSLNPREFVHVVLPILSRLHLYLYQVFFLKIIYYFIYYSYLNIRTSDFEFAFLFLSSPFEFYLYCHNLKKNVVKMKKKRERENK